MRRSSGGNGREPLGEGLRRGLSPVSGHVMANAAGIEAAIRGDVSRAQVLIKSSRAGPNNAEYRETFSRIQMNTMGWISDEPLSPDPAAAP